jgi:predicted HTH transcriptional regulator
LSEWTIESIKGLLDSGAFESEVFDFKEALPDPRNVDAKGRLQAACAAFANTDGGFLIFGVADDRRLTGEARLIGIPRGDEFTVRFGGFPRLCHPIVFWQFRNPPVPLPDDRVLHVVHIPKSTNGPHAVGTATGWRFPKRTNQGTDDMSIQEIRTSFLGYYEKRLKLELLVAELEALRQATSTAIVEPHRMQEEVGLFSFDLQVLESILADTYSVTAHERELHRKLVSIRQNTRFCNAKVRRIEHLVYAPLDNRAQYFQEHNSTIRNIVLNIAYTCDSALLDLREFLSR